jgi:hypothetical protein
MPGDDTAATGRGGVGAGRGGADDGTVAIPMRPGSGSTLGLRTSVSRPASASTSIEGDEGARAGSAAASGVPQKRQNSAPGEFAPRQRAQIGPIGKAWTIAPRPAPDGAGKGGAAGTCTVRSGGRDSSLARGKAAPHILQKFIPGRLSTWQRGHGATGPS